MVYNSKVITIPIFSSFVPDFNRICTFDAGIVKNIIINSPILRIPAYLYYVARALPNKLKTCYPNRMIRNLSFKR